MTREMIIDKAASVTTYSGAGGAVYFGLTANEIGIFGGLIIGLLGLIVKSLITWHFKNRELDLTKDALKAGQAKIVIGGDDGD